MLQGIRSFTGFLTVLDENRDGIYLLKTKTKQNNLWSKLTGFHAIWMTNFPELGSHMLMSVNITGGAYQNTYPVPSPLQRCLHPAHLGFAFWTSPVLRTLLFLDWLILEQQCLRTGLKGYFPGPGEMVQWLKHLPHKNTGVWISRMYVNKCCVVLITSL